MHTEDPKVIVALDYASKEQALAFVEQLDPALCRLKVGKEMFTLFGPEFVRTLVQKQFDVFLDLKLQNILDTDQCTSVLVCLRYVLVDLAVMSRNKG